MLCNEFNAQYNKYWKDTQLQKNAKIVLDIINQKEKSQSILSAQASIQLHKSTKYFNISNYFNNIIGLDNNMAEGKLESGYKLVSNLNISKKEILLIGDTNYDYVIANKLGIDCILYYSGHQSKNILLETTSKTIDNLKNILGFL